MDARNVRRDSIWPVVGVVNPRDIVLIQLDQALRRGSLTGEEFTAVFSSWKPRPIRCMKCNAIQAQEATHCWSCGSTRLR